MIGSVASLAANVAVAEPTTLGARFDVADSSRALWREVRVRTGTAPSAETDRVCLIDFAKPVDQTWKPWLQNAGGACGRASRPLVMPTSVGSQRGSYGDDRPASVSVAHGSLSPKGAPAGSFATT